MHPQTAVAPLHSKNGEATLQFRVSSVRHDENEKDVNLVCTCTVPLEASALRPMYARECAFLR